MEEKDLKKLFQETEQLPPSPAGKAAAVSAALEEFDQTTQGSEEEDRPNSDVIQIRSRSMNQTFSRWLTSGLASAAVVMLAVVFVFNMTNQSPIVLNDELDDIPVSTKQPGTELYDAIKKETGRQEPQLIDQISAGRNRIEEIVVTAERAEIAKSEMRSADMAAPVSEMQLGEVARLTSLTKVIDPVVPQPGYVEVGQDGFEQFETNPVKQVHREPVSTFSIDVDTASYSFVRKQLNQGVLPQKAAVRLEEMVNYFPYDYSYPATEDVPFKANVAVLDSPWHQSNKLVHIGIQGYEASAIQSLRSNLVFLLDVSGSMAAPDKLPLVKQSMSLLLSQLQPEDTVAIAVYAGAAGTVLEPTQVKDKQKILDALGRLQAGGSTAGAAGIKLAYQLAEANFVKDGVNRVFLATDGDFNVGITNREELQGFVERKRETGIYLSVLGFGQGNYQDQLMQQLAQNGNGIAAYIDTLGEAQKVLVEEATSMLFPIANDVKIQIEFNPSTVKEYRLLGYETRMLAKEDFNNDAVDAGEIGAGHSVTAIYEITPVTATGLIDESRYQNQARLIDDSSVSEYGFLKIRYKRPGEDSSNLISQPILTSGLEDNVETRFAVAVAGFAQLLKDGKYTGDWSYEDALELAMANKGADTYGYRAEFTQLIRKAMVADEMQ